MANRKAEPEYVRPSSVYSARMSIGYRTILNQTQRIIDDLKSGAE